MTTVSDQFICHCACAMGRICPMTAVSDNFVLVHCGPNLVRLPDVHGHTAAAVVAVAGRFAGWR